MRVNTIRSILLLIAIIAIDAVSINMKLRSAACPKCLISEKQCAAGNKIVRKNDKNACEACPPGTEAPDVCSKTCTKCAPGHFTAHDTTVKCDCCPVGE